MEKRTDAQIYIYGHKKIEYDLDNKLYTPIEVGAARHEEPVYKLRDNTGENISDWNGVYAENTGLYWIWKNVAGAQGLRGSGAEGLKGSGAKGLKYIGVCQYRRRLDFKEDTDFEKIFRNWDAVVAYPYNLIPQPQYCGCHNKEDIELAEEIVKSLYPDYREDWDKFMKKTNKLYYSAGFIMKKKDFNKYCKWLFSIFDEFKKRHNWDKPEQVREYVEKNILAGKHSGAQGLDYQMQLFGFLQERLMTLYIQHNFEHIYEMNYTKFEGVEKLPNGISELKTTPYLNN